MKRPGFQHIHDRPLASPPFTSYRLRGPYGWIHIGAMDAVDAMREAARSTRSPDPAALEVWNGTRYVPAWNVYPGATLGGCHGSAESARLAAGPDAIRVAVHFREVTP